MAQDGAWCGWLGGARSAPFVLAAALAACAVPQPPANPFAGAWATPEHDRIAFADNTVVVNQPNQPPTPMNAQSCDGAFRFAYAHRSRSALLGLATQQPDVQRRLAVLLVRPDYPVAEVVCGEGGSTYVLLDEHDLVAIHRDRDIAGLERLTRL